MQFTLHNHKLNHHNNYKYVIKLISLIICCFLLGCGKQNQTQQVLSSDNEVQVSENAININTASVEELEKLPRVGIQTAKNIVEYREKYGKFRKPEHLMLVRRISDKHFRLMRNLVKVE